MNGRPTTLGHAPRPSSDVNHIWATIIDQHVRAAEHSLSMPLFCRHTDRLVSLVLKLPPNCVPPCPALQGKVLLPYCWCGLTFEHV